MSFTSTIDADFHKLYNLFVKQFKSKPSLSQVIVADLSLYAPVLEVVVSSLSGSGISVEQINNVITTLQTDIVLATKFAQNQDYGANLTSILSEISTNLQTIITFAKNNGVLDSSKVIVDLNKFVSELNVILNTLISLNSKPVAATDSSNTNNTTEPTNVSVVSSSTETVTQTA